jgi:hypothetical protein
MSIDLYIGDRIYFVNTILAPESGSNFLEFEAKRAPLEIRIDSATLTWFPAVVALASRNVHHV